MTSSGWTIASDLNSTAGAARAVTALNARSRSWTCGWDSHEVPSCFQMNATASRRSTWAPWLARNSISAAMAWKTCGLE